MTLQALQETNNTNEDQDLIGLTFPLSIESEDFSGTTLDDAINDKSNSSKVNWPNEIYHEFMNIVTKYKLSNSCGDRIIKWFNLHTDFEKSPLPKRTCEGRKFLDNSEISLMKFKEIPITNFQGVNYNFYYQPIIHAIKALFQTDITEDFVFHYQQSNTSIKTYGEQFECDWWKAAEADIPIDNILLSIIIYADSTTCDYLGKTTVHPIYISFGNIPNWRRNKSDAKILVGYLPKIKSKDINTKNSESFRRLQRMVFQQCIKILLSPILNTKDMYFVVKNNIYPFTPKISVILSDLAEAAIFSGTYSSPTSKSPCCNCLVTNEVLNSMNLSNITIRKPNEMKKVINEGNQKKFSIHPESNFFWNFK
jgi:hypothetical protein